MATVPGAMLLCASSPYARRGALWDAPTASTTARTAWCSVWQAPTRTMNPTVPQRSSTRPTRRTRRARRPSTAPSSAPTSRAYITREAVEAVASPRRPRARARGRVPVSSPSSIPAVARADSITLAIAHGEGDRAVLDVVREASPPFSPEGVVSRVRGAAQDLPRHEGARRPLRRRVAARAVPQARHHVRPAEKPKSDLYRDVLPLLNSGKVELLDDRPARRATVGLERRTARGGKDSIDHAPGAHDDLANCAAGVIHSVLSEASRPRPSVSMFGPQIFDSYGRIGGQPAFETPMPRTKLPHEFEAEMNKEMTDAVK